MCLYFNKKMMIEIFSGDGKTIDIFDFHVLANIWEDGNRDGKDMSFKLRNLMIDWNHIN